MVYVFLSPYVVINRHGVLCRGVLAQAKNGNELFWEEKFHAAKWEGPSMHSRRPAFFPFKFGWGRVEDYYFFFPCFPLCSQYVPFKFSMGSQYVPQVPNVFPNIFSIPPHFYPICFGKCCPPSIKREELYTSK